MPAAADTDRREALRQRLRDRLHDRRMSPRKLSLAIGANHAYVSQILAGKGGMPSADRILRMAEELDTTADYLLGDAKDPAQPRGEVSVGDRLLPWNGPEPGEPGIPLVGTGDCADLEVTDSEGHEVAIERSTFDPEYHVRYISRPPALRGAKDLYAIYYHGSSMEPRFEQGEVGIVDPLRPPRPGDYVVVQLNTGKSDEVISVLVKRLVRLTAKELLLEQFNPPLTFALPRNRVARVHRIVPQTDLLFG